MSESEYTVWTIKPTYIKYINDSKSVLKKANIDMIEYICWKESFDCTYQDRGIYTFKIHFTYNMNKNERQKKIRKIFSNGIYEILYENKHTGWFKKKVENDVEDNLNNLEKILSIHYKHYVNMSIVNINGYYDLY